MPLPNVYTFTTDRMSATLASLANQTCSLGVPWTGRIIKLGVTIGSAVTGTATITVDVNGTAVPGGVISVPAATPVGSNASTVSVPVSVSCNEDDSIDFVITGAATGGGVANVFAVIRDGF